MSVENKRLTDEEFTVKLIDMLKAGSIRLVDVPKRLREAVARGAYGRYPLKDFSQLGAILKSTTE